MIEYRLDERIGVGGLGDVYRATEILPNGTQLPVACKLLKNSLRDDRALLDMFQEEAEINRRISHNHPGLVSMHHWVQTEPGEHDYMIMELIDGCSLQALIDHAQHGADIADRLPFDMIRLIARDLLDALAYVHRNRLYHRDISPVNVLISRHGEVKLADLGLAGASDGRKREGFSGKPAFASRETLPDGHYDERSDLYSFGAMLYAMLTGAPPFGERVTVHDLLAREFPDGWQVPPLPASIDEDLRTLAMGLLQAEHDKRNPGTAAAALAAIRAPDHADLIRGELGKVAADLRQRAHQRDKAEEPGSRAGVRLMALHMTAVDAAESGTHRTLHKRAISPGHMARLLGKAVLIVAAIGGLALGLYRDGAGPAPGPSAQLAAPAEEAAGMPAEPAVCVSAPPVDEESERSPTPSPVAEERSREPTPRVQRRKRTWPRRAQRPPASVSRPVAAVAGRAAETMEEMPGPSEVGLYENTIE
jgi:serine/threonine protein kinase